LGNQWNLDLRNNGAQFTELSDGFDYQVTHLRVDRRPLDTFGYDTDF